MVPSSAQCRAARALLNITQDELSKLSGVSKRAIAGFEAGETRPMRMNLEAIRMTLEKLGVELIEGDGVKRLKGCQISK
jgi:predicted transcriptional regulator